MTIRVIGTPQLTLLELICISEDIGVPFEFLVKTSNVSFIRTFFPKKLTYYSSVRPVYVDSMEGLRNLYRVYSEASVESLFLVQASTTELQDRNVPIYLDGLQTITKFNVRSLLHRFYRMPMTAPNFMSKDESSAALLRDKSRESLLSKLQTSFYKIKDKEERSRVQTLAYRFLVLRVKHPMTGSTHIDKVLLSPIATKFREALREIDTLADMDLVAERYSIDRFEVAYVLQKNGRTPKA